MKRSRVPSGFWKRSCLAVMLAAWAVPASLVRADDDCDPVKCKINITRAHSKARTAINEARGLMKTAAEEIAKAQKLADQEGCISKQTKADLDKALSAVWDKMSEAYGHLDDMKFYIEECADCEGLADFIKLAWSKHAEMFDKAEKVFDDLATLYQAFDKLPVCD